MQANDLVLWERKYLYSYPHPIFSLPIPFSAVAKIFPFHLRQTFSIKHPYITSLHQSLSLSPILGTFPQLLPDSAHNLACHPLSILPLSSHFIPDVIVIWPNIKITWILNYHHNHINAFPKQHVIHYWLPLATFPCSPTLTALQLILY